MPTKTTLSKTISLNNSAKSVMPNGSILSRGEILSALNLDPGASPDAWLAVIGCGSNASALTENDARILVEKGAISKSILSKTQVASIEKIR